MDIKSALSSTLDAETLEVPFTGHLLLERPMAVPHSPRSGPTRVGTGLARGSGMGSAEEGRARAAERPDVPPVTTSGGLTAQSDRVLLEGAHSRRRELWLVLQTVHDFIRGFRTLHFVGPCVTIFGSARFDERHAFYAIARDVGRRISEMGFTVMSTKITLMWDGIFANCSSAVRNGSSIGTMMAMRRSPRFSQICASSK